MRKDFILPLILLAFIGLSCNEEMRGLVMQMMKLSSEISEEFGFTPTVSSEGKELVISFEKAHGFYSLPEKERGAKAREIAGFAFKRYTKIGDCERIKIKFFSDKKTLDESKDYQFNISEFSAGPSDKAK